MLLKAKVLETIWFGITKLPGVEFISRFFFWYWEIVCGEGDYNLLLVSFQFWKV